MPDYNQGGFHQDDTGIYADPSVQGSTADYDSWDWKQIMAAITGGSNLTPGAGGDTRASAVSDPKTLVKAANDFQYVQEVMAMVAKSLADQSKALAGGDGAPWQGAAADAFMDTMSTFSKQVANNADALNGGSTGSSVGQNLVWSANALLVAQANIHAIDAWYANEAARLGVKPMANGLMPISQKPELVQMMTDDMRAELKKLATNYAQVSQNLSRVQPKPVTPPTRDPSTGNGNDGNTKSSLDPNKFGGTGGGANPPKLNTGGGGGGGANPPKLESLDTNTGSGDGTGTAGTVNPFGGGASAPELDPTGSGTGSGSGISFPEPDPTGTGTGTAGTVNPFSGGASAPELDPTGSGTGSGSGISFPELDPTGTGTGTAGTVNPFSGGASAPELDPTGTSAGINPYAGTLNPTLDSIINPSTATSGSGTGYTPSAMPVTSLAAMPSTGSGTNGSSNTSQVLAQSPEAWTGGAASPEFPGSTSSALPEAGAVGLPGTGGTGLPTELSSAPGTAGVSAMPASDLISSPVLGATPTGSTTGAGVPGMPMMPMAPGAGAGAGVGAGGAERPDAAGLLGGDGVVPWAGGGSAGSVDDFEPVAGVAAGGVGLTGPEAFAPGEGVSAGGSGVSVPGGSTVPSGVVSGEAAGVGVPGMPMMPMAPGAGAGAGVGAGGAERPDAAGLLGGDGVVPWAGGGSAGSVDDFEPVAGAQAGGAGLSGPEAFAPGESVSPGGSAASAPSGATLPSTAASGDAAGVGVPGMPMMPMSPGMGAGTGAGSGGAERPDSAGLLGGEGAVPWTQEWTPDAEEGVPVAGAPSGGSGLTEPDAALPAEGAHTAGQPSTPLVAPPVLLAPMTGTPAAPGRRSGERPDATGASALLGASGSAWATPAARGAEPEAATLRREPASQGPEAEATGDTGGEAHGMSTAGAAPVVAHLPDDRVAMVNQDEEPEDVSAWNAAGAGFAPLLLSLGGRGTAADTAEGTATTRYTVSDPSVWDGGEGDAAQRAEQATGSPTADALGTGDTGFTTWRPAQRPPRTPEIFPGVAEEIRCGAGDDNPDDSDPAASRHDDPEEASGEDEDEDTEAKALDLLRQDVSAWGPRPGATPDSLG
ncbi:hypothetical protein GCM10010377_68960 [Streptomyces viridiviolaceus]|uniref:Uncharacterized protein n=1 Tax=Streptomyces viridiviolaceus TaxID=68282 RepID=A0ABW2E7M6_9ACTN|nr:hypothetical protein [Streptomyces viridiviolaceus]GHB68351.1 hypothetical protein GCM10010377_68960 [Streptomyces viridiviolaceus]